MRCFGPLAAGLIVLAVAGCGSDAPRTPAPGLGSPVSTPTVRVSGEVARSCFGPLIQGRARPCSNRAVFERNGSRLTVNGRFAISLRPGNYRVSVDTCVNQQTLRVHRAIMGLKLVPRCALPLSAAASSPPLRSGRALS